MYHAEIDDSVPPDLFLSLGEVRLLMAGQKIHAIKSVRERYGLGLKEAKDFVDAAEVAMGLVEFEKCWHCNGTGQVRRRKDGR